MTSDPSTISLPIETQFTTPTPLSSSTESTSLPVPAPQSRPYTETGAASARTSFTRVDMSIDEHDRPLSVVQGTPEIMNTGIQPDVAPEPEPVPQTPQTLITFLLISGRRRTMSFEPDMTLGRVKELVWNAWPSDWQDERPPAPSYLRILYLGKILQDDDTLTTLSFPSHIPSASSLAPPPTIVHISIRPYAPAASDADGALKKGRRRARSGTGNAGSGGGDGQGDGGGESGGLGCGSCGCIIC